MQALQWLVVALALFLGGWLVFDGGRALVVGDYVTPSDGPYAGQLGPWSRVVSAVGLEPRSTFVKGLHLALGIAWLIALVVFTARPAAGWWIVMGCSVASLWYLPLGTILSVVEMALLLTPQLRALR